jgi:amidase
MEMSAREQAALVRSGDVSARELVEASLRAVERLDGELGAFVAVCGERALEEAGRICPGDPRPLCGVPFGVKDLFAATEGLRTTHGSAAFDWVARHDAPHVRGLRDAGAILIGKTNTPELGLRAVTEPARHGPTRNPRDMRLSPGGSSGGSAAAVAAGLVAICDGSDAGGSIRIPAACCGVVGLKPSRGLVPQDPDLAALGGFAVFGAVTRNVADAAVALDAMTGTDEFAAAASVSPDAGAGTQRFADAATRAPARVPVHVALEAPLGVPVDPEPRAAAERAAGALAAMGHDVREQRPPWDDEGFPPAWELAGAYSMRRILETVARLNGRPLDPAALEPATRAWLVDAPPVPESDFAGAADRLRAFAERILADWPADGVLLTPTLTRLPREVAALRYRPGVSDEGVRFSAFLRPFNVTGQPAITVPAGPTTGAQLVGPPGRDDLVLAVAAQLEAALR